MKSEIWNLYFFWRSRNSKYHFLLEELHVLHWFISSASPENTLHESFQTTTGPPGLVLFQQEVDDRCELLLINNPPSAGAASFQCTPAS